MHTCKNDMSPSSPSDLVSLAWPAERKHSPIPAPPRLRGRLGPKQEPGNDSKDALPPREASNSKRSSVFERLQATGSGPVSRADDRSVPLTALLRCHPHWRAALAARHHEEQAQGKARRPALDVCNLRSRWQLMNAARTMLCTAPAESSLQLHGLVSTVP